MTVVIGLNHYDVIMKAEIISRVRKCNLVAPTCMLTWLCLACLTGMTGCKTGGTGPDSSTGQHLDFNQDVQPILASNCFSCHGPDPAARKAGLRLDLEESAFKKRQGKPDAIVPGHPDQSEMIRRIESSDSHHLMPQSPQGEAKPMKPAEIAVLKRWVAEGAHYKPHWAFDPPLRASLPVVQQPDWVKTPIDNFILARLTKEGLHPSPEADRRTLIRRVTLDLTGLLPTRQEINGFVEDKSPQAYEHLVDRLLASTAYAEQRTRYWLDYARYADTYGIHLDNDRHIWAYRDYLIRAFQANKPFDKFAREQISGDLIPATNLDPIIASAYVRAGVSSNEGGAIPEELKVNLARERAEAYGALFLGLTVGCAVCHDHKYDPTTQKDFYQLTAFFNNIQEEPYNFDMPEWAPVLRIPRPEHMEAYNQVLSHRSRLQEQLRVPRLEERKLIERWLDSKQHQPQPVSEDKLMIRLRMDEGSGSKIRNSVPNANPVQFSTGKLPPQWGETSWLWPDLRMDTNTRINLGQAGNFEWNQPFSSGGWFMVRSAPNIPAWKIRGALISKMDTTQKNRGWDLATDQGVISVDLVNGAAQIDVPLSSYKKPKFLKIHRPEVKPELIWPTINGHAIRVSTATYVVHENSWQHFFFTYDGSGRAAGIHIYVDGVLVPTRVVADSLNQGTIRTSAPMQLGMREPDVFAARDTRYQDIRLYGRNIPVAEAKRLPYEDYVTEIVRKSIANWDSDELHVVSDYYINNVDQSSIALKGEIAKLNIELDKLSEGGYNTIVSEERPGPAYASILNRGVYTDRKQRVEADTPHFLPPIPAGQPHNRLALAEWTVSPNNPLTARVTVNRMWNELFGTGLVETTDDYGIMGQRPSNPALLDWLAVEFRESGWNIKHMYKLMVMSATYRQSAKFTPESQSKDPRNLLVARGPRFRMDAEMLRDIALQASGLLVSKVGGPSVKPYQPPNIWESVGYPTGDTTRYAQDHGDALYRRSMYTYWKRMANQPNMDAFDAPVRDTACTRRQRTDTPLQALVTLNDPQWVEASRQLAERVIVEGGKAPEQRINYLSELVLSHPVSRQMESELYSSLNEMERHYASDPNAARQLLAVGEKPRNPLIPAAELAAWTMVVSEVLNLDEALNK